MKRILAVLIVCVTLTSGKEFARSWQRIVGGEATTINEYPYAVVIQFGTTSYTQFCGGSILTTSAVLTAAHCLIIESYEIPASILRIRVGSTFASSGGATHFITRYVFHSAYNPSTVDNDIAVLRTSTHITYTTSTVGPVTIAGTMHRIPDNAPVWAIGWGVTQNPNENPEILRHVRVYVVNQAECARRYGSRGYSITNGMLCSGVLDVGGRDQCQGDSGGPLMLDNVQIGVCSWGVGCGDSFLPGVNARVSSYTGWIINAAQS